MHERFQQNTVFVCLILLLLLYLIAAFCKH